VTIPSIPLVQSETNDEQVRPMQLWGTYIKRFTFCS